MRWIVAFAFAAGIAWAQLPPSIQNSDIDGSAPPPASTNSTNPDPVQSDPVDAGSDPEPPPQPEAAPDPQPQSQDAPPPEDESHSMARDREDQRKRQGKRVAAFWVVVPGR